jgi:hypothetical protein
VIQQLICNFSLDFEQIEQAFNIDFRGYFGEVWPQLEAMAEDGLIELDAEGIACCRPDACWCARCAWCSMRTWTTEPPALFAGDLRPSYAIAREPAFSASGPLRPFIDLARDDCAVTACLQGAQRPCRLLILIRASGLRLVRHHRAVPAVSRRSAP